ncbi:MAG: ribbon-helix-helix protein, CopG family [Gemmatimonadetes bacterium]|nr:ribbon-helix-helix protein, CopG family [Gemmatimonadota bacterium]
MRKKTPYQVYLDSRDRAFLERLASQLGLSKADVIREALRRWAAELSGERDALLGLIGSMDNPALPGDLSTRHDDYAVTGYPVRRVAEPSPDDRGGG